MNENIPELKIELMDDTEGSLILLEQDSGGNLDRVAIHPLHMRYMAERFGLVQSSDPQALRTIATLTRRLLVLQDRVSHLADWLVEHSDHQHADLSYEQTYARATADIADEFCAELSAQRADEKHTGDGHAEPRTASGKQLTIEEDK